MNITIKTKSKWECYLFGSTSDNGICWVPNIDETPNIFWRWMQYIIFGNKWIKKEKVLGKQN